MGILDTLLGGSALDPAGHGTGNVPLNIPSDFGYVVLISVASVFLLLWQGIKIEGMRKKFKITYPTLYSTDNDLYNCYQRAHQHTVENYPQFLALMLFGGLEMPVFTSIARVIWILGRIAYSRGYYTGDPEKRLRGAFGNVGTVMMLAASVKFALHVLIG